MDLWSEVPWGIRGTRRCKQGVTGSSPVGSTTVTLAEASGRGRWGLAWPQDVRKTCQGYDSHTYGRSMMLPGSEMVVSAFSASPMICRCWLSSFPSGKPKGNCNDTTRGNFSLTATCRNMVTDTVGMPSSSIARCTSPTARLHPDQAGVRNTASAPSSLRCAATSFAVVAAKASGSMI